MEKALIIRLIVFVFAWLNSFLVSKGYQPLPVIGEEEVAYGVTFVVSIWTLWKDNNITKSARAKAQKTLDAEASSEEK